MAVGRKQLHINQRANKAAAARNRGGGGGGGRNNPATRATDARFKLRQNTIKVKKSGANNEVKLYTSHFDARNKIAAKRGAGQTSQSNVRGGLKKNSVVSPAAGNNQRRNANPANRNGNSAHRNANNGNANNTNRNNNGARRNGQGNGNTGAQQQRSEGNQRMKVKFDAAANSKTNNTAAKSAKTTTVKSKTGYRESTFTGKSLRISTTNELAAKDRKATVRGKTLSVTAKNRSEKGSRTKASPKQIHKTIKMDNSKWIGPSVAKQATPEPVAHPSSSSSSSSKKTLSAKVVISNLHPNVTQEDIMELFGAIGPLRDGRIKNVGTAEVVYRVSEDAFAAYSKYHGRNLDGQPMILKITTADDVAGPVTPSSSSRSSRYDTTSPPSGISSYHTSSSSSSTNTHPPNNKPVVFTVKL